MLLLILAALPVTALAQRADSSLGAPARTIRREPLASDASAVRHVRVLLLDECEALVVLVIRDERRYFDRPIRERNVAARGTRARLTVRY